MEWEEYWEWLLSEKKYTLLVEEMDEADKSTGKETTEKICHEIYIDYGEWRKHLSKVKDDFLHIIENLQGVHLQTSRIKSLDSLLGKVITKRHAQNKGYICTDGSVST